MPISRAYIRNSKSPDITVRQLQFRWGSWTLAVKKFGLSSPFITSVTQFLQCFKIMKSINYGCYFLELVRVKIIISCNKYGYSWHIWNLICSPARHLSFHMEWFCSEKNKMLRDKKYCTENAWYSCKRFHIWQSAHKLDTYLKVTNFRIMTTLIN